MVPKFHDYERESENFYDRIASQFDHSFDGLLASFFKRFILKNLKFEQNSKILDIGCANGKLLAMLNDKKKIVGSGLDISSEMIKVAKLSTHILLLNKVLLKKFLLITRALI